MKLLSCYSCLKCLLVISYLTLNHFTYTQKPHWNKQVLTETKASKILDWEQSKTDPVNWFVKVKKNKKVALYFVEICQDYDQNDKDSFYVCNTTIGINPEYDLIEPFRLIEKEKLGEEIDYSKIEVAVTKKGKSSGVIIRAQDYDVEFFEPKHFFEKINWKYSPKTHVAVYKKKKWGIYDWYRQEYVVECIFESIEDFPENSYEMDGYSFKIFTFFNKKMKNKSIDMIELDQGNGDGVFKARNKVSKKWGMYQYLGEEIKELVPMKYDSLRYFPWNGNYTAVYNRGKVGFYLSKWTYDDEAKQTVNCLYEDYKRYVLDDQTPVLAVKKNGMWAWIDWLTGEEKTEFKYKTPKDLPYPKYKQKLWLDD